MLKFNLLPCSIDDIRYHQRNLSFMELKHQTIVVTGGSQGIGFAVANICLNAGAKVVIASRSRSSLNNAFNQLTTSHDKSCIRRFQCDVSNESEVENLFRFSQGEFGTTHGIVCAAGILGEIGKFTDASLDEWRKVVDVNLFGSIHAAYYGSKSMDPKLGGRIIFFSGGGQGPQPRRTAYVASKGAIWRLTESLGHELATQNIFVNAIAPGAVNTKFLDDVLDAGPERTGEKEYAEALEQKKNGGTSPDYAAKLALWLLSSNSQGLYGKTLSAKWDPYIEFELDDLPAMSESDIFTMKRVIRNDGQTRWN